MYALLPFITCVWKFLGWYFTWVKLSWVEISRWNFRWWHFLGGNFQIFLSIRLAIEIKFVSLTSVAERRLRRFTCFIRNTGNDLQQDTVHRQKS